MSKLDGPCECGRGSNVKSSRELETGERVRMRECCNCKARWKTVELEIPWNATQARNFERGERWHPNRKPCVLAPPEMRPLPAYEAVRLVRSADPRIKIHALVRGEDRTACGGINWRQTAWLGYAFDKTEELACRDCIRALGL